MLSETSMIEPLDLNVRVVTPPVSRQDSPTLSPQLQSKIYTMDDEILVWDDSDYVQSAAVGTVSPASQRSNRTISIFDDSRDASDTESSRDVMEINSVEIPPAAPQEEEERAAIAEKKRHKGYDLKPPPPLVMQSNAETLAEQLFSSDHLKFILDDPSLFKLFSSFLRNYQSQSVLALARYLDSQKAIQIARCANAVAQKISPDAVTASMRDVAFIDPKFEAFSRRQFNKLVDEALPAFVTHQLTVYVTEKCLVKEITGTRSPIMRDLVEDIAEVYCITDPSLPDNPIVYCSEEFSRTTQYSRNYAIGKNCRFLQGPKSSPSTTVRIRDAVSKGIESAETFLNYRRDGSPFLNLLLVAPLYDNKGKARYFIGCQIDVTNLVEDGRGLESFQSMLKQGQQAKTSLLTAKDEPLECLRELGQMLNPKEMEAIQQEARVNLSAKGTSIGSKRHIRSRKYINMDDDTEDTTWPPSQLGSSGRLPGVYKNYLLVRPAPDFDIVFTSASLRIPDLLQSNFLSRISGPNQARETVRDAFKQGMSMTAKIYWLNKADGSDEEGKTRWIHCTPMLGSDNRVGVWMVVMVDNEYDKGHANKSSGTGFWLNNRLQTRSTPHIPEIANSLSEASVPTVKAEPSRLFAESTSKQGRNPTAIDVKIAHHSTRASADIFRETERRPAPPSKEKEKEKEKKRNRFPVLGKFRPFRY